MLDNQPSNILRPQAAGDLKFNVSDFINNDKAITLPASLGVECSPFILIYGDTLSINGYKGYRHLARARLSVASVRNNITQSSSDLAIGLRATLFDESDLRLDKDYEADVTKIAEQINALLKPYVTPQATTDEINKIKMAITDTVRRKTFDSLNSLLMSHFEKGKKWNKTIVETAIALKMSSTDSLAKNLQPEKLAFWLTGGYGIGDAGQVLLGLNYTHFKDSTNNEFKNSGTCNLRFYFGSNKTKILCEAQAKAIQDKKTEFLVNAGLEAKIIEDIWAEFTAGNAWNYLNAKSGFVTDFKIRFGL